MKDLDKSCEEEESSMLAHVTNLAGGKKKKKNAQVAPMVKNLPSNAGDIRDVGSVTEAGRSPGEGNAVFLPGKYHGQRSLAGYSPWSYKVRQD